MNVHSEFEVRSFTCSGDNRRYSPKQSSPRICPHSLFSKIFNGLFFIWILWMYRPNLKSVALLVPEIITLDFWAGVANVKSRKGGHKGSGIVPFERALVTSYKPSIIIFSLALHVSEILPLLCSSTLLFSTPPRLPKISPRSSGSMWMALWLRRVKVLG